MLHRLKDNRLSDQIVTSTVKLEAANHGPTETIERSSDWTLALDSDTQYVINEAEHEVIFDKGNVSGTITLSDGSELNFENIDKIQW